MTNVTEHDDERRLQQMARMAACRRKASEPDVDAEWQRFRDKHVIQTKTGGYRILAMWASALAGAAAMFVGFVLYINLFGQDDRLTLLQYDEAPRAVTLTAGNDVADLSSADSLNYFTAASVGSATGLSAMTPTGAATANSGKPQMQSLSTPRGMDFKVTLHDGTEVWLNAESTIEFPTAFTGAERRVNVKGEAYFKVAHNAQVPFVVDLGDKLVRVLGTEFDVRHYDMELTEVVLVEGSVQLCDTAGVQQALLSPGDGALWGEGSDIHVRLTDTYGVRQWVDGLFYFEEHALSAVLRDVGRWYNYGVVFDNEKHTMFRLHFSASRNDSIEQIIDDLNLLCGFKIAIEGKNIVVY